MDKDIKEGADEQDEESSQASNFQPVSKPRNKGPMDKVIKPRNKGPMDKDIKEGADEQDEESSQASNFQPVSKPRNKGPMDKVIKPRNKGPMDKDIKEGADEQDEESSQASNFQPVSKPRNKGPMDKVIKPRNKGPMDKDIKEGADEQDEESSQASNFQPVSKPRNKGPMDKVIKPRNKGPMDKDIKEEADEQDEESSQASNFQPVSKPRNKGPMDKVIKPRNKGPMDKDIKEGADEQDEESSQASNFQPVSKPCDKLATSSERTVPPTQRHLPSASVPSHPSNKQGEKSHATHSFSFQLKNQRLTFTCNQAGTVEEVLKRSPIFTKNAGQNEGKELVILKNGKAISSHTPCRLLSKDEPLIVKYIKAVDKPKLLDRAPRFPYGELVMFHVVSIGGDNVAIILRNTALKKVSQEITVYAYKGEKVKHALKRDGRLRDIVFKKNCVLSDTSTNDITEMSSPVDDLDGKTFKITLLDKCPPPESPPGSLDDSQRSDSDGNQDPPQQSATTESETDDRPKEKPELKGDVAPEQIPREIPNSETLQRGLNSQFKDLVKDTKTQVPKLSRVQNLFRVEYGKNDQTCREVKTMKKLMELSNSVCHVRINGRAEGSGFLLFDKFVLTNGHVINNVYSEATGQLDERVTVHFSYESLDQMEGGQDSRAEVEEVVGFAYYSDESGHRYDWALLKLGAEQNLPDGLLTHFGFLQQSGGICIIGHPDGSVKMIEPCLIVSFDSRSQVAERHYHENPDGALVDSGHYGGNPGHIQWVTPRFFEDVAEWVKQKKQVLTYESSFYFGSSGSPVFDEHCNVVAMHAAGYVYCNARGQRQSVIEYGYPLSLIIEQVIVQLVEGGRFDVLKKYLTCSYARHQNMMSNLKKLVEGRNLTAFRNAAKSPEVINDASLKTFFEFLCRPEELVPMV